MQLINNIFFFDKKGRRTNVFPKHELKSENGQIITGYYKDYDFQVRAYFWTGQALEEVHLYSSEVEMNLLLHKTTSYSNNCQKKQCII
ncbi:hypothetical protein [Lysinibacillus sp. FSL K6-3209]|uniref:hypothetical protein n=1 Tax=Lysinibacillus sp. FSL K6-3209 TaxID=2921497 RepID=UPI0030DB0593